MKFNNVVLQLIKYDEFRCSGPSCQQSCCEGWKVPVDKITYIKYRKIKSPSVSSVRLDKHLKRSSDGVESSYAFITLNSDGSCPFLEESLCKIHANLGDKNLCNTCYNYPRIYSKVGDLLLRHLTLSCEEVAKLLLLETEPLEFAMEVQEFESERLVFNKNIQDSSQIEILQTVVSVLQNRELSIPQRLLALGILTTNLVEFEDTQGVLGAFRSNLENREFEALEIEELGEGHQVLIEGILASQVKHCKRSRDILGYVRDGFNNIGSLGRNLENLNTIFENYLVVVAFGELTLLGDMPLEDYFKLLLRYSLLRTLVLEDNSDICIDIVRVVERSYAHSDYFKSAISLLDDKLTLDTAKILLSI